MKRIMSIGILCFFVTMVLCSCKKNVNYHVNIEKIEEPSITTKPTSTPSTPSVTPEPTKEPEDVAEVILPEGMSQSRLTGLLIDEEVAKKRPIAIQYNNLKTVRNQWGISEASILYEALVEGGITRLLGIFDEVKTETIGSVRSSRHYYVSIADEYDAIYIHYGKTSYAINKMSELGIDHMDGMSNIESTLFYRVDFLKAPHNAFTGAAYIEKAIKKMKFRTEFEGTKGNHFDFYDEDTELSGDKRVDKVTLMYSSYTKPYFIYDSKTKQYKRFQFDEPHVDSNTKEQLAFKNIIVQFVKEWDIDKNDYQTMDIEDASGTGYYITNGKMTEITWEKNEKDRLMVYYDTEGNRLNINQGKTFISYFPDGNSNRNNVVLE